MGLKDPISTTMMRVLFVAIAAVMLLSSTDAHLDQLCSSTCAAHPGRIDFYFGTYHGIQEAKNSPGGKAPGTIYLSNSGGSKLTSSFKEMFAPSSTFTITTVDATKAALIKAVNNPSILDAKCMVSCYSTYGAENLPTPVGNPAGKWVVPVDPTLPYSKWGCKVGKTVNFWSRVSVNKATSGDWKLEITGTNAIFDPDGNKLCGLSKTSPRWIGGMQVANGEKSCTGTPTVSGGVDPASVAACKNMLGGGICSGWKCKDSKATPSGSIKCSKGIRVGRQVQGCLRLLRWCREDHRRHPGWCQRRPEDHRRPQGWQQVCRRGPICRHPRQEGVR